MATAIAAPLPATTPLSVIICTHNPRPDYLERCGMGLKAQSLPTTDWELIVVDNASALGREPKLDLSWHFRARLVHEPDLGLTNARLRGIREAAGELLVFVDDDNVLDPDFLEVVLAIASTQTFLGAWSGQCRPEFEEPAPAWTRRYWGNLVIREFDADTWSNLPHLPETMPCGAGLCVRRAVARHYLALHETGARPLRLDRAGSSLLSGGDNDLAACACDIGQGVGLIHGLKLTHLIPPERLTAVYLTRLAYGIAYSGIMLQALRGVMPPPRSRLRRLADRLRALRLVEPHRSILRAVHRAQANAAQALAGTSDVA